MDVLQGTSRYPQPLSAGAASQTSLHQVGWRPWGFQSGWAWFHDSSISYPRFVFHFLKRGLTESSFLKRTEAGGSVPSITISIPKPSFAPSVASATADKINTLNHKTGHYHCSDAASNLKIPSYANINLKLNLSFLLFFQVQARQNSPVAKPSSSDRSTG